MSAMVRATASVRVMAPAAHGVQLGLGDHEAARPSAKASMEPSGSFSAICDARHEAKSRAAITPSRSCAGARPPPPLQNLRRTDAADVQMQVDAVDEGTADAVLVAPDLGHRAGALPLLVAEIPAGTRVAGRHEHEPRREGHVAVGPGEHHRSALHGLAYALQNRAFELRQLVQEEHSVVGQGHLARPQGAATSYEPGQRGAVMRMAEGALARDDGIDGLGGHGMNHGRLQHLVGTERRHDGGHAGGEHGLARPGRSHHEQPVTAGRGDLEGPLGRLVTRDLREVERLDGRHRDRPPPVGRQHRRRASLTGRLSQRRHGEQPHVVQGHRIAVGGADEVQPEAPGADGAGERARHRRTRPSSESSPT